MERARLVQQQQQQTRQAAQQQQQQLQQEQQIEAEKQATAKKAAQEAAEKHAQFVARYLNAGFDRLPGAETLAIVVAADDRTLNHSAGIALANHFKSKTVETLPALFKPAFVADGLFARVFDGSTDVFGKLDLVGSLDALMLARESVEYSSNPSLDNVLTATMQLEVVVMPVSGDGQNQTWTFTAHGSGFKQADARTMAEERIIKQINDATNLSLVSPNN